MQDSKTTDSPSHDVGPLVTGLKLVVVAMVATSLAAIAQSLGAVANISSEDFSLASTGHYEAFAQLLGQPSAILPAVIGISLLLVMKIFIEDDDPSLVMMIVIALTAACGMLVMATSISNVYWAIRDYELNVGTWGTVTRTLSATLLGATATWLSWILWNTDGTTGDVEEIDSLNKTSPTVDS